MEIVYRAQDIAEAEIVSGMLQAHGIEAHVGGYYLQGGVGELAPMGFANVQVEAADLGRARQLVGEYTAAGESSGAGQEADRPATVPKLLVAALLALLAASLYLLIRGA
ncbi:MAG: DUF2007 domain-containing protein [Gammaproteobacteria bacterium]|nr:DUF2007 domain-containing protein [Gammaproteobacteria bacterium]